VSAAMERTLITLSEVLPTPKASLQTEQGLHSSALVHSKTSVTRPALGWAMLLFGSAAIAVLGGFLYLSSDTLFAPARPDGPVLDIILANTLSDEIVSSNFEPVRVYLEQAIGRPIDVTVGNGYKNTAERLMADEFKYALLPDGATRTARTIRPDLKVLATKIMDNAATTDGYILAHRDKPLHKIADLKGTVFCYTDEWSSSGHHKPRKAMVDAGLDPDVDITWYPSGEHHQVLKDILAGKCDAGGTYSLNYLGADELDVQVRGLKLVANTGPLQHDHLVTNGNSDPVLDQQLVDALIAFDVQEHAGTHALGATERITGFAKGWGPGGQ
jgi:ABC-type phosphate/phosphonate transport system substrate-binding protein